MASPFADIVDLLHVNPVGDEAAVSAVRRRDARLTKPAGSLGELEKLVEFLARWQGKPAPTLDNPMVAIFAGNHGVTAQGVSAFPSEVTAQMVANFTAGGAAISQICALHELNLRVFELALELPTGDITEEAALDEAACAATMAFGMEATAGGIDLLVLGEMGIGNTTIAAAVCTGLFGGAARDWVGPGTGLDLDGVAHKTRIVERAIARHAGHLGDPLEVLRRLGGRELAAIAGAILAARMSRIPVIIDGYVASAAAAVLWKLDRRALDHCEFGHLSAEPAHERLLGLLGRRPLLDLGMRLGEGSGAALAAGLVKAAAQIHAGMATFTQAGVADRGD